MKLFVYGVLRNWQIGKTIQRNDTVNGLAVDLGDFPALVALDCNYSNLEGDVIEVTPSELVSIDEYEDCPSKFIRRKTTTTSGHSVQVYMFNRAISSWSYPDVMSQVPDITRVPIATGRPADGDMR